MMICLIRLGTLIFLIYGFNRLFQGCFRIPGRKTYKMANKMSKLNRGTGSFALFAEGIADFISAGIRLSESKACRLSAMLRYFDEPISPERFVARQLTKSLLLLLPALILYPTIPFFSVVLMIGSILSFFKTELDLEKRFRQKQTEIEYELPRFCATILQEIKVNRDVIGMIDRYVSSSGKALKRELEITLADMKSSNQEAALVRLESRLSLGSVSDIVRGLVGVVRGDDMRTYFEMLSHDLDAMELQRLETQAARQPEKIKKYQFLILASMILIYVITISVYLLTMDRGGFL